MTSAPTILQLIDRLEEYILHLKELQKHSFDEFKNDWKIFQLVDHTLHLAIECAIDIAKILIIENKFRKPRTYKEVFEILRENKIISDSLAEDLKLLAEFRNRLIHDYLFMDPKEIYDIYQNKLNIFSQLSEVSRQILKKAKF